MSCNHEEDEYEDNIDKIYEQWERQSKIQRRIIIFFGFLTMAGVLIFPRYDQENKKLVFPPGVAETAQKIKTTFVNIFQGGSENK